MVEVIAVAASVAVLCAVGAGVYRVVRDSGNKRGRWGINTAVVTCPQCETPLPRVRRPRNLQQALWGGWTCPVCQTELDKWGKRAAPRP